jgi:hypothetical protein
MDLKGRIVLWTPATSQTAFNNALCQKLTDAGTAAIVYVGYGLSVYRPTPVLRLDTASVPALRARLAEGPLTLTLDGISTSAWHGLMLYQQSTRYRPPSEQTLYYSPDVAWTTATFHYQYEVSDLVYPLGTLVGAPTVYRADGDYRDDWMSAPCNPALGEQARAAQITRDGDKLNVALPVFSDAAGHRAETAPRANTGSTVLADDGGKVLARNDTPGRATFDLPRKDEWYG